MQKELQIRMPRNFSALALEVLSEIINQLFTSNFVFYVEDRLLI